MQAQVDPLLQRLTDYCLRPPIQKKKAIQTAHYCLMDSLGCALLALNKPDCQRLIQPVFEQPPGDFFCRIPGTAMLADPLQASFSLGVMIRWLDYNDTWLAAEWGHPSDNIGMILALADHLDQKYPHKPITMGELFSVMIKAYEIQGVLALKNSFNQVGLDHVILVKLASTAAACILLGSDETVFINALSQVWLDGHSLRSYRHYPNTGSRKSWAAGDASRRGLWLALISHAGEMGYPLVLNTPKWGFCDVLFNSQRLQLARPMGSYIMENILFKLPFPAEFHAQTALDAAIQLYPKIKSKWQAISQIVITTTEAGQRIISKSGPLKNPADRDHCLEYIVAVGLLYGTLSYESYELPLANDPEIDRLRSLMTVREDPSFTQDYLDPSKRAIPNSVTLHFNDGSKSITETVHFPLGHPQRRDESISTIESKFEQNLKTVLPATQIKAITALFKDPQALSQCRVSDFMATWKKEE